MLKSHANGCNIVCQQLPTLLDVTCCIQLHTLLHVVGNWCSKFETSQTFSYVQREATTVGSTLLAKNVAPILPGLESYNTLYRHIVHILVVILSYTYSFDHISFLFLSYLSSFLLSFLFSFICLLVGLFVPSFVHSFIHSFIHLFIVIVSPQTLSECLYSFFFPFLLFLPFYSCCYFFSFCVCFSFFVLSFSFCLFVS